MQATDGKKPNESLTERINELEALLARKKLQARQAPAPDRTGNPQQAVTGRIPVLDELVSPDFNEEEEPVSGVPLHASHEQIDELIGTIESRLSRELEALVDTLKATVKESILAELKHSTAIPDHDGGKHIDAAGTGTTTDRG